MSCTTILDASLLKYESINFYIAILCFLCSALISFVCRNISYNSENDDVFWGRCSKCGFITGVFGFRCKNCNHSASNVFYFFLTVFSFILSLLFYKRYGLGINLLLMFGLLCCIVVVIVTDFFYYIIPDTIHFVIFFVGLLYSFFNNRSMICAILSAILCLSIGLSFFSYYYFFAKKDGFGFGDVKLMGAIGSFLSFEDIPLWLFFSGIIGMVFAIIWRFVKKNIFFPFGPILILSFFLFLLFPLQMGYISKFFIIK